MSDTIRVLIWDEDTAPAAVYPQGINAAVAEFLKTQPDMEVRAARIADPDQGVSEDALTKTDVLVWWGHARHDDVTDEHAARVAQHVRERGMGFVPLHSGHFSKPFKLLMGTSCDLGDWSEEAAWERVYVIEPEHPIARGLPAMFVIPRDEMYCERFDVPAPEELVFLSSFASGEVFRSGCCWTRGRGRIFYWRPGHETYPVYFDLHVRQVIANAVRWCEKRP